MAWLFGQVWLLCLVAFLLGAVVTWVTFVVPARRAARRRPTIEHGWNPSPAPGGPPQALPGSERQVPVTTAPPEVPLGSLNSALAALDAWNGPAGTRPGTAEAAMGALEKLGVGTPPDGEKVTGDQPAAPREPADDAPGGPFRMRPTRAADGVPRQHGSPENT